MIANHSSVFHRKTDMTLPSAVAGDGPYIIDQNGKRYFDACGGAAVSCLGHNHPAVIAAIKEQIDKIAFAHTAFFTNEAMESLAEHLVAQAPRQDNAQQKLDHVYFVSGGSEAVEAALKMARQYFLEINQPQRTKLIARRQSYHGNTLGALATGGNQWRRQQFEPLLIDVTHIAPCYAYRGQQAGESLEAFGQRVANELETALLEAGPETVAAFVAEPVVGATAGAVPSVPGYFKRIRDICDRYGILLILDEVMCGMGRTGTLFAYEQEKIQPDLVALAKGLGAGYQPIGALMVSDQIFSAIRSGSGFFQHGHTYMGHPTACAASLAVQKVIMEENLLEAVSNQGALLKKALEDHFQDHPFIGDIRGRGLFLGLELVADRSTKDPFPADRKIHAHIKREALDLGLMCYPMGGTIDGKTGDHILLAPPFTLNNNHVSFIVDRLGQAIGTALKDLL